jgi:hypothetical protein
MSLDLSAEKELLIFSPSVFSTLPGISLLFPWKQTEDAGAKRRCLCDEMEL